MNRRGFFDRVDDWLNPIVVKELKQAVQSRLVVSGLMMFLFLQVLILTWVLLDAGTTGQMGGLNTRVGRRVCEFLQGLMLGTCLMVPLYVGGRLIGERSDTHTDLLFITSLKPRAIVSGKFLSGLVLVLLIFSACAPFLAFTYLLRGIDVPSVLILLGLDLMLSMAGLAAAIFLGVIPAPRPVKGLLSIVVLIAVLAMFTWGMDLSLKQINGGMFANAREFWTRGGLTAGVIVGVIGLFFCWSITVLAPPAANKGVLMRLYILGIVVLLGVGAFVIGRKETSFSYVRTWITATAALCCLQLLISINEREKLGHRVARTIPRSLLWRPFAFLFYSGSGGGVLFCALLLSASIALALGITVWSGAGSSIGAGRAGLGWYGEVGLFFGARFAVLLGFYTFCFAVSAVVIRSLVFRNQVRPGLTWMIVLLLVGVGSMGPYLVALFSAPELLQHEQTDRSWLWTNPFYTIDMSLRPTLVTRGGEQPDWEWAFSADCMMFLYIWAGLATVCALPWLFRQIRAFRPTAKV